MEGLDPAFSAIVVNGRVTPRAAPEPAVNWPSLICAGQARARERAVRAPAPVAAAPGVPSDDVDGLAAPPEADLETMLELVIATECAFQDVADVEVVDVVREQLRDVFDNLREAEAEAGDTGSDADDTTNARATAEVEVEAERSSTSRSATDTDTDADAAAAAGSEACPTPGGSPRASPAGQNRAVATAAATPAPPPATPPAGEAASPSAAMRAARSQWCFDQVVDSGTVCSELGVRVVSASAASAGDVVMDSLTQPETPLGRIYLTMAGTALQATCCVAHRDDRGAKPRCRTLVTVIGVGGCSEDRDFVDVTARLVAWLAAGSEASSSAAHQERAVEMKQALGVTIRVRGGGRPRSGPPPAAGTATGSEKK